MKGLVYRRSLNTMLCSLLLDLIGWAKSNLPPNLSFALN